MFTKSYKVYGADGHRQRRAFGASEHYDWSTDGNPRIVDVLCSDRTGTEDYCEVIITRSTESECNDEMTGQLSDGLFENYRTGRVEPNPYLGAELSPEAAQ